MRKLRKLNLGLADGVDDQDVVGLVHHAAAGDEHDAVTAG